ncbi:hypothetical protein SLS54_004866 [Diplodia seriata]
MSQEIPKDTTQFDMDYDSDDYHYIKGWRQYILTLSVALCMFLVNIEVSVVGTSLVSIGDELHGFQQTGWVVTGYLVTYTSKSPHPTNRPLLKAYRIPTPGMIILWAKLSDILGRKPITTATVTIFVVFSGGCAAAQSMTQLVPAGLVTVVLLLITLPANFPHQGNPDYEAPSWGQRLSRPSLARLDITDGVSNGWSSAAAIVTLTISGILWLAFVANEWFLTSDKYRTAPIFPWRFVQDRALMGTFIISLVSGIPYTILVMAIPQHFQTVAGLSPLAAGVRLLPFNLLISSAAVLINVVAGTTGVAPVYLILTGSVVQLVGISLLCTLPTDGNSAIVPAAMYGYQMLAGCGIGCVFGILLQLPPQLVEKRDLGE